MIDELARHLGIEDHYIDFYGNVRVVPHSTLTALIRAMGYSALSDADADETLQRLRSEQSGLRPVYVVRAESPPPIRLAVKCRRSWSLVREGATVFAGAAGDAVELGRLEADYYDLTVDGDRSTVIAVPDTAYLPPVLEQGNAWGIAAQLYSLRSRDNWGIGDFGDLRRLMRIAHDFGAATVAVNPIHEMHLTNPTSASPYSPNSRFFLNALYIDVPAAAKMLDLERVLSETKGHRHLRALRKAELVDYAGVAEVKLSALRALHGAFEPGSHARGRAFKTFVNESGPALRSLAVYEAIMAERVRSDPHTYGWLQWPEELRVPDSPAVDAFVKTHRTEVEFYEFLQWLADEQLARAVSSKRSLAIGLYRDLAVGVDANSADVWADRESFCLGICVGAPPDPLNSQGQNWALPPLDPHVLRARAYAPYIALLRANMRHAGALRIDHVMGLMRLFCIPAGAGAAEGAYLRYPFEEMLGILALESRRNHCMVVGEDLGTVPEGFRERMSAAGVFGCRLLYFERYADGSFRPPEAYDRLVVASPGTHDVAPLAGFWTGTDLAQRARLGALSGEQQLHDAYSERSAARKQLVDLLLSRNFLGKDGATDLEAQGEASQDAIFSLVLAAYRLLGRSAARLLLVQLEDALLQRDQVNTPGTFHEVPNWRRRLVLPLEKLARDPIVCALFEAVGHVRGEARG